MGLFKRLFGKKPAQGTEGPEAESEGPEQRVFDHTAGSIESFYAQMSRDLVALHGPLVRAEYLEHFPVFRIRIVYDDGTVVQSGERTGRYDIHFLSLGYAGEGPGYAKAFLAAAGIDLSTNEIKGIRPGDVITAESPTEQRFARPDDKSPKASTLVHGQLGVSKQIAEGILNRSLPILSPDGSSLVILKDGGGEGATVDMLATDSNLLQWSIPLPSSDCEAAFISANRLLVLAGSSETQSTIQLLDLADGSTIDTAEAPALSRFGTDVGWVGGKRMHTDLARQLAVRQFEDQQILRIRVVEDRLQIVASKVPQVYGEGPRVGPDGECYFLSYSGLNRVTGDESKKEPGGGNHCICSDPRGRIYCGGGYGDMSGESYLHVVDFESQKSWRILLGLEPIHRLNLAGDDQVLASSIVERSQFVIRSDAYVAALDVGGGRAQILWEKRIEGLAWDRAPVILTVPDESWGLLQTRDKLQQIALATGEVLDELSIDAEELVLGTWSPTQRRIYVTRFPDRQQMGALHCIEVPQE